MVKAQLPFFDLAELDPRELRGELIAAAAITVMAVPQGVAYAIVAGLPPAMGLYAGAVPAIVGALLRSSRHVVIGPTNAVSLVLSGAIAARAEDPAAAAATIALMVGALQLGAGLLRLSGLVDFISTAVVTGYITGAATSIVVGQLPNVTGTEPTRGDIVTRIVHWLSDLPNAHLVSVALAAGTFATIAVLRRYLPRGVPALVAIGGATLVTWALGLTEHGVAVVSDLAPVPAGLPPLTLPTLSGALALGPVAVAAMVLSLVESTSVARAISARSGQRVDITADFLGLGAANVAAAFTGGYPVSGSLSRSALTLSLGAKSRLAVAMSGVFALFALLWLGPLVDFTPISALAGLILIVAVEVIEPEVIRKLLNSEVTDRAAFVGTLVGAWLLPLDQAIYVGVGISLVLFLRRARLLTVRELWVDDGLQLREVEPEAPPDPGLARCRSIRVLHVEGPLFFGAASELDDALVRAMADPDVRVLLVRLKRAHGVDYTAGTVLARAHEAMAAQGRHLMLVGMRDDVLQRLRDIGVAEVFTSEELYPTQPGWFVAMNAALTRALDMVEAEGHLCGPECPVARYLSSRAEPQRLAE